MSEGIVQGGGKCPTLSRMMDSLMMRLGGRSSHQWDLLKNKVITDVPTASFIEIYYIAAVIRNLTRFVNISSCFPVAWLDAGSALDLR